MTEFETISRRPWDWNKDATCDNCELKEIPGYDYCKTCLKNARWFKK